VSDRSTSTKIVAASNSSQAIKDGADLVLTGTADQTNLNTLLAANAGGSIYLAEGTYSVSGAISIPNNTTLFGAGAGTFITIPNAQNGSYNFITNSDVTTGTHVAIHDLQIDGNKANQTSGFMYGIYFQNMGGGSGGSARDGAKITNVIIRSLYGNGGGVYFTGSSNNTFTGSSVQGIPGLAVTVNGGANNTINGNILVGNNTGIYLSSSTTNNVITGNNVQGNTNGITAFNVSSNTITGNTFQGNTSIGVDFTNSFNNSVTGNTIQGGTQGITVTSTSNNNTISGNSVQNNSSIGISVSGSSGNAISGNKFHDNGGLTGNNSIYLSSSATTNSLISNDITDTSCSSTCNAINISDSGSISNYLANNRHSGSAANPSTISDSAPNTIYANQQDGSGNLINKSQGGGLAVGASSATASLTLQGGLVSTALPVPTLSATVTNVGTTGATTHRYQITALDGIGETNGSTIQQTTTGNATLSGINYNTITWTPVGGVVNYKIYRCSGAACTPAFLATVTGNNTSYNDIANGAPSGATPTANTTGGASIANSLYLGTSSSLNGSIVVRNATNANTISILSGATSGTYSLTLPTAIAGNNQCLQSGTVAGGNVPLTFGACGTAGTFVNLQGSTPGTPDIGSINVNGTIISAIGKVGDATNGFTFDPATGPDYHGTARPTKRIAMSPEFGGAVLRGDGTNNTGTMTTAFDATNFHNYYNWSTAQVANQDFDVTARLPVPNDYSGLTLSPQICFFGWSDDLTNGTISVTVNDTANAAVTLSSAFCTWSETCRTISGSPTIAAGGFLTIKATLQAATSKNTRLGEFRIDYLSKF
jgi:parallel beta-helix repeat protein